MCVCVCVSWKTIRKSFSNYTGGKIFPQGLIGL